MENKEDRPAGFWIRLSAYIVDNLIFAIVFTLISSIHSDFDAMYLFIFPLSIIVLWALWGGKTPGKALVGIHIVKLDGSPIGWVESIIRYLGYILNGITLLIGFLMIAVRRDKRGLHDLVAKTMVVHES